MAPGVCERLTNRQTGRSPSASERPEHVAQVRTRRTAAPDQPAVDPSSIRSPAPSDGMNQRSRSASTPSFSTQSTQNGHFVPFRRARLSRYDSSFLNFGGSNAPTRLHRFARWHGSGVDVLGVR